MNQSVIFCVFAVVFLICFSIVPASSTHVVCYFASWTVYRKGNGKFDVDNIDPSLCTHLNFAFIGLNTDASIFIIDPWESNDEGGYHGFRNIIALKETNPSLKVMISMGGWNEGAEKYSKLAADPVLRKTLANNVLAFINEWGFDGFDLDWEYPGSREGSQPDIDKDDFVALLTELSNVLKPQGLLFSAAVAGGIDRILLGFDVPKVSGLLDMINVMVYDFHGHFEPWVGHGSPLHASSLDYANGRNSTLTVATGIEYWLYKGADPAKINLGIASYGRVFTLADPNNTQLYAPTLGGGLPGPYTNQTGFLGYNEICEYHLDWTYYWDDEQKVPHRVGDIDQWVGYEDIKSVGYKVEFALAKNLGGFMMWALDTDDFTGTCGTKYPLLTAIHDGIAKYRRKGNIVCYYMNSNGRSLAPPEKIDPKLCTHLNYAFVRLDEGGNLTFQNESIDITQGLYKRVVALKKINPKLKVLLSIGDTDESIFAKVAADDDTRKNLIKSTENFLKTYSFDGLDVDWELPRAKDRENFIQLLKELRELHDEHNWILSAAVYPNPSVGYNVPEMVKYLHMFNVMCYNYYGPWSKYTGQNSPLFASSVESGYEKQNLNMAASMKNWIDAGVPKQKIIVGVAFYGRAFTLADPEVHGLHAPITGAGTPGTVTYRQVCTEAYANWTTVWDDEQKNHYKYLGNQWLGYDDEKSMRIKAQYIASQEVGGVMIWQIGQDDVFGDCGQKQALLRIIHEELKKSSSPLK